MPIITAIFAGIILRVPLKIGALNLIPIFSVILGYLLLGERLNTIQIFASIIILIGVTIVEYRKK